MMLLRRCVANAFVKQSVKRRAMYCRAGFGEADMIRHLKDCKIDGVKVLEELDEQGRTIIEIHVPDRLIGLNTDRVQNLTDILDGYFKNGGHHLNINAVNRNMLKHAMEHPEHYSSLTIRVSGYAVAWSRLTREQQLEVIARTIHDKK